MVNSLVNIEKENEKVEALLRLVAQRRESLFSFENKPEKSKADASGLGEPKLSNKNKQKQHGVYENVPDENKNVDTRALDEHGLQEADCGSFENKPEPVHVAALNEDVSEQNRENKNDNRKSKKSDIIRVSVCSAENSQGFVSKMAQAFNKKLIRNSKSSEMESNQAEKEQLVDKDLDKDSEVMQYKAEIERLKAEIKRLKEENVQYKQDKRQDMIDECDQKIRDCNEEIQRNMRSINEAENPRGKSVNKTFTKKVKNGGKVDFNGENCNYEEVDKIPVKYELNRYDAVVGDHVIFKNKRQNNEFKTDFVDDRCKITGSKYSESLETNSGELSPEDGSCNNEELKEAKSSESIEKLHSGEEGENRKSRAQSTTAPQNTVQYTSLSHSNLNNHNLKTKQKLPAKIIKSDIKPNSRNSQNGTKKNMDQSKPLIVDAKAGESTSCQVADSGVFENQPVKSSIAHFSALERTAQNVQSGVFENKPAESKLSVNHAPIEKSDSGVFENQPSPSQSTPDRTSEQKVEAGVFENQPVKSSIAHSGSAHAPVQKSDSGVFENQPTPPQSPQADAPIHKVNSGVFENKPTESSVRSAIERYESKVDAGVFENQPVRKSIAHSGVTQAAIQKADEGVFENKPVESNVQNVQKADEGVFENKPLQSTVRSSLVKDSSQVSTLNDSSNKKPSVIVRQASNKSSSRSSKAGSEVLFENVPSDTIATVKSSDVLPEFDNGRHVFEKKPSSSFTDFKADLPSERGKPLERNIESRVFEDYDSVNSKFKGSVFGDGKDDILDRIKEAVSEVKRDHSSHLQS